MITASLDEIKQLSTAERIQIVEDIWDSIASQPETISLTEAQTQELDQRLDDYIANPQESTTWREVQRRIQGQK